MVGHNGRISWGATLAYTDCEDLFIEKLHPDDPTRYQFGETWRQAEVFEEVIEVRFQKPHREMVTCTHHGPLIHKLMANEPQPLAYSSTALRGGCTMDGFGWLNRPKIGMNLSRPWPTFTPRRLTCCTPTARATSATGYRARCRVRADGDGSVPAPRLDQRTRVDGHCALSRHAPCPESQKRPSSSRPTTGCCPPENCGHNLGQLWRNGYRGERIRQLLHSQASHSQDDCRRYMRDQLSLPGLELVALLQAVAHPTQPTAGQPAGPHPAAPVGRPSHHRKRRRGTV
jgi:penicillin amidase